MPEPAVRYPDDFDDDSSLLYVVNNLKGVLDSDIDDTQTDIGLVSSERFPPLGGYVSIENEIIWYGGIEGTTLKECVRGAIGTVPASHSSGTEAFLNVVDAHHNLLKNAVVAVERELGLYLKGSKDSLAERLSVSIGADGELLKPWKRRNVWVSFAPGTWTIDSWWNLDGVVIHYVLGKDENKRVGTLILNIGSSVEMSEVSTLDVGDTSGVSFSATKWYSGVYLKVTVPSEDWRIRLFMLEMSLWEED